MLDLLKDNFTLEKNVIDLGNENPLWAGILSAEGGISGQGEKQIQSQFIDEAELYVQRYQNHELFHSYLRAAFKYTALQEGRAIKILDLGSGAGNTVIPLAALFPEALIVATDLSLPLLSSLKKALSVSQLTANVLIMQMDAEEVIFADEQFDLVVGGAILHHLDSPSQALKEVYRVLKKGGEAIFFEPFEIGYLFLAQVLRSMITRSYFIKESGGVGELSEQFKDVFERLCKDWEIRRGRDKTADHFKYLDDKWLFTRSYLEENANLCGFSCPKIFNLFARHNLFSGQVSSLLGLTLGCSLQDLPPWVVRSLEELDNLFSDDARNDLIFDGGIVLKK